MATILPPYIASNGNFRSITSGNFNVYSTWQIQGVDNNWYSSPYYPKAGNIVLIQTMHNVTLTQNESCKSYTVLGVLNLNSYTLLVGLDVDAQAYLTSAGITTPSIKSAFNNLFINAKYKGYYSKLIDVPFFYGGFSAANKKLKNHASSPATSTLTNFISGDYDATKGLKGDGSSKYLASGANLSAVGLNRQDLTIGFYSRSVKAIGLPGGIGGDGIYLRYSTLNVVQGVSTVSGVQPNHTIQDGNNCLVSDVTGVRTYSGGVLIDTKPAQGSASLTGVVDWFRYAGSFYFDGYLSMTYIANAMTSQEVLDFTNDLNGLHAQIGRRESQRNIFIGDSTTEGTGASSDANTYPSIVNASLGGLKVNVGAPGAVFQYTSPYATLASNYILQHFKADTIGQSASKVFVMPALNDLRHNDSVFTAATFGTQFRTELTTLFASGFNPLNLVLITPIYNDPSKYASGAAPYNGGTVLRHQQYVAECRAIAIQFQCKFFDAYQWGLNNGGNSLLQTDGIHGNDTYYAGIASGALAATTIIV